MKDDFTILVADDDQNDAILLEKAIRANDIQNPLRFVRDGHEAIDYLEGSGKYSDRGKYPFPRVIISDLKMPRLSGLEFLEWLRKHPRCFVLPMILMSGSGLPADVERAYRLGVNSYFQKPASFQELVSVIGTAYRYWERAEVVKLDYHP